MTHAIEIEKLRVSYGSLVAVKELDLVIPAGEVFGFVGPNGAGKTSTIRVLATLQRPTAGRARIGGKDVMRSANEVRRKIGFLPDSFGVYEELTVEEYLHFFAAAHQLPGNKRRSVVRDVLALTELTHKAQASVDALSRGMRQRLGLARVLLHDPEVLLLDEPASGLDPRARIEIRELLKALQGMGKTILISSHILHELSQLCTRIGILEAGRLVADGTLKDIFSQLALQRIIHLQLVEPSPELIEAIGKIEGVQQVDRQIDRLAIHLRAGSLEIDELHHRIVQLGARVTMYQPEALDMETAFMKLTEGRTA